MTAYGLFDGVPPPLTAVTTAVFAPLDRLGLATNSLDDDTVPLAAALSLSVIVSVAPLFFVAV